jgi:hypothetical protein
LKDAAQELSGDYAERCFEAVDDLLHEYNNQFGGDDST